nr:3-isopropylmalate dehydratase small subunit [uncultured Oscillibacter sp.]
MIYRGTVHKYGDHIDTDVILPGKYLSLSDPAELAGHCMEGIDADFPKRVRPMDVVAGGEDFGCGSSREHAPVSLKACGVSCVIAKSYARIFYRNAINIGLPIIECPEAAEAIQAGDIVEVDPAEGRITDLTLGRTFQGLGFPDFIQEIIRSGGLMNAIMAGEPEEP